MRTLQAVLLLQIVLTFASVGVHASARCKTGIAKRFFGEGVCDETLDNVGELLDLLKIGIGFAMTGYLFVGHLRMVARQEAAGDSSTAICLLRFLKVRPKIRAGAWTLAASPRILAESCREIQQEMLLIFCFFFITAWSLAISHFQTGGLSSTQAEYAQLVCGQQGAANTLRRPCFLAFRAMQPGMSLVLGMGLMGIFLNICTPIDLWSPVVQQALRHLGPATFGIRTYCKIPWFTVPASVLTALLTLNFNMYKFQVWGPRAPAAGVVAQVVVIIAWLLYVTTAILCMLVPGSWAVGLHDWKNRSLKETLIPRQAEGGNLPAEVQLRALWKSSADSSFLWRLVQLLRPSEVSWRHRFMTFLVLGHYVWGAEQNSWMITYVILWFLRALFLLAALATRDAVSTFQDLERHPDPGFGLLVSTSQLRAALQALLEGREYTGPLKTFKASIWRMRDTVALSYRWQSGVGVVIKEGLPSLNMSRWQITALESALRSSEATYVWLDCLSVPQAPCQLQRTLLARMMAVYASAGAGTVALRSREVDGGRYHQRAWTLQEFCCSGALSVYTEESNRPSTAPGSPSGQHLLSRTASLSGTEERRMLALREWHLAHKAECVPYWICKDEEGRFSGEQRMRATVLRYQYLEGKVFCTVDEDKLRALVPLVRLEGRGG